MGTVKHIKISNFLKQQKVTHFARQAVAAGIERFSSKIEIMGFGPQKSTFLKIFLYDVLGTMLK